MKGRCYRSDELSDGRTDRRTDWQKSKNRGEMEDRWREKETREESMMQSRVGVTCLTNLYNTSSTFKMYVL